ncbi:MAG: DUF3368 domain-containing protein [Nitrospirae bacterium]|nr:DUF3368 domain-containing protein [Nitrospirota bacterium]
MHKNVVVNTSPLFYLHRLECLHILEKLYGEVVIPQAVVNELMEGKRTGEDVPEVSSFNWIKVEQVNCPAFIKMIPDLGQGEAEVLALGDTKRESLLVIDDSLGRRIAKLYGFKFTGTAGVLISAKKKKHITEVKSILVKLKEVGFYITDKVISEILKASGEI